MEKEHIIVIGAGIGGLSSACLLAAKGHTVSVYEKNDTVGGKMQQFETKGYRFDTGPSLLTMPFQLEKLFTQCGHTLADYLTYTAISPLCRYFYPDGVVFDNYQDEQKNSTELKKFAADHLKDYARFLNHAEALYKKTADSFLFNPLYDSKDLKNVQFLDVLGIDAFSTVSAKVDQFFSSPHLRQFFKRFATYHGSSPFKAPATLNVIPHVELSQGGYYVQGGMYQIAESLKNLAESLGVTFNFNQTIHSLPVTGKQVSGVRLKDGTLIAAKSVFANSDASDTILNLLPPDFVSAYKRNKQEKTEPSCSGFVLMMGCKKIWPQLRHHNIFFSSDYEKEFDTILTEKRLPEDPTMYVANTSFTDAGHAPKNSSNLFILINAPYVDGNQNWEAIEEVYPQFVISELEKRGLDGLEESIEFVEVITPKDFLENYRSNRGSLYGTSSNSKLSAFLRPRNKFRQIENLYLVGGSTHPGGGIPLVIQSAFNAVELFVRYTG